MMKIKTIISLVFVVASVEMFRGPYSSHLIGKLCCCGHFYLKKHLCWRNLS